MLHLRPFRDAFFEKKKNRLIDGDNMCTLRYKRWIIIKASRVRNYLAYFLGINFILCQVFFLFSFFLFFLTLDGPLPPPAVSRGYLGSTRNFVATDERGEEREREFKKKRLVASWSGIPPCFSRSPFFFKAAIFPQN